MIRSRFVFAVSLAGAIASSAFAQFANPGFESGDFSGWTIGFTANGRTNVSEVVPFDIDGAGPLGSSPAAHFSVGQTTFQSGVQAGVELTQTLNLTANTTYNLGFNWAAHHSGTSGSNAQGGVFSLIVDGTALSTQAAGSIAFGQTISGRIDVPFTPTTTGNYVIGARITRPFTAPSTVNQYVDNFTPVPEPASLAALGLGAAALLRRRRQK